jgi:hypothetical protein
MGAAATPLAFGEIYTALQAGVLDGLEHDPPTIVASKFYETAKFYSLTQHNFSPLAIYFSDTTFNRMDAKLRDGFIDVAKKAAADTRIRGLAVEKAAMELLVQKGVTVVDCDREAFRKRVLPRTDAFLKARPEAIELLQRLVGGMRGGLNVVMVTAMVLFSGISGSKMADVAAVGSVLIPAARRSKQNPGSAVTLKIETLPELKADVDRPGFTMLLSGDPRRIDGDQLPAGGGPRWGLLPSLSHLTNDGVDFGIARIDEATLTKQSIFDLARETEPLFARSWAEVAERANSFLAWPLWGLRRLDQDVIDVRPAFVGARRFADIHLSPRISSSHYES